MRLKVAECAALYWEAGQLVWDDYLNHRKVALTSASERVLRWFGTWRELDTAAEIDDRSTAIAEHLLDAGLLIAEGTPSHRTEEKVLAQWRPWGAAAMHYHYASRTLTGSGFLSLADDAAREAEKLRQSRPPAPFKTYDDRRFVPLDNGTTDDGIAADRNIDDGVAEATLVDTLHARRSARDFSPSPISMAELGTILDLGAGIVAVRGAEDMAPAVFKTSPSAGGRDPIEVYVCASRIDGMAPGVYHYSPSRRGLEELGPLPPLEARLQSVGLQPWLADGAALLLYTAVVERSQWRYDTGRAYRDVLLGLGHLSQTVLLVATALGLGSIFATAVCDEQLESLIGVDHVGEVLLGVTSIGRREPPREGG